MPTFNRTFELGIEDVSLIDTALRERAAKLAAAVLVIKSDTTTADRTKLAAMEAELRRGETLLGHLHDQKIFFRPKNNIYVGG